MNQEGGPLFSLPVGEGVGALLCLAGGDAAGAAPGESGMDGSPPVYGAPTQQAVVVAYHLLRHGEVRRESLTEELAALDGNERELSVFRGETPSLRSWLDSARKGDPLHVTDPGLDPAVRVAPVGMWYRRQPEELINAALETARVTHLDGHTAVTAAAVAGGVAASCFAQAGHDLMMAVADIAAQAARALSGASHRFAATDDLGAIIDRFRDAIPMVGRSAEEMSVVIGNDPLGLAIQGIVVAAGLDRDPAAAVAKAARIGGREAGAITGAMVGARVGVKIWPWDIPNDTWFVALGHRLVEKSTNLEDLPVPYAVEQRLSYSSGATEI